MRLARIVIATAIGWGAIIPAGSSPSMEPVVLLAPFAPAARSVGEYVALGDSYVAGPLIPAQTGTPGCARSDHNYPSLVAKALGTEVFRDASCSGATTREMTARQRTSAGVNAAQLDSLTTSTDLVTVGIGGNDIGFGEIITTCAKLSSTNLLGAACRDHYRRAGRDQLVERIKNTGPKVAAVLKGITDRAPKARVLVVGYPGILPDSGPGCYPVVPFSAGDVAWLRGVSKALNGMLAQQAAKADLEYVDLYRPSVGHDVCTLPGTKWVEGLVPTSPAAPAHPNALGMRAGADTVLEHLGSEVLAGR